MKLQEMQNERAKLIREARQLVERAEKESRDLTAEENTNYEKYFSDVDGLDKRIERERQLQEQEKRLAESELYSEKPQPVQPETREQFKIVSETPEYRELFGKYLAGRLSRDEVSLEANRMAEKRALQADVDTQAGYLKTPQQFITELIKDKDNIVHIRRISRVFKVLTSDSLGAPSLDTDIEDSTWQTEIKSVDEDTALAFGKRELVPHQHAKLIKISNKLIRVSAISPEALVRERMAYKFGITEEKTFMTGTGSGQPLGVFTASNNGISTGRDVSTDNTTTAITFDNLKSVKGTLKSGYFGANTAWVFHRDAITMISKLKDGNGRYLWEDSVKVGDPDKILSIPAYKSEYAPNTFTTGLYVGILGDWSYYWIADNLNMDIQVLKELYARTNQIGYIGRAEVDAMPVLENAFVRVKLA